MIAISDQKGYSGIYDELLLLLSDEEAVEKIYEHYNGMTITFPKKLYSQEYVETYICTHYGFQPIQDISRYVNLSTRRVMQIAQKNGLTKMRRECEVR